MDGCTLDTEGEKERVIKCIEAAIQRRVSEVIWGSKLISILLWPSVLSSLTLFDSSLSYILILKKQKRFQFDLPLSLVIFWTRRV